MNTARLVSTASLAALLLSAASFGATVDRSSFAAARPAERLVPVKVVHPAGLPVCYEGTVARFSFTLDQNGAPHNISPEGRMPSDLAARMIPVLAQWRFSATQPGAVAGSTRYELPIQLVAGI